MACFTQACVVHSPPRLPGGVATRSSPRSSAAMRPFDGVAVVGVGEQLAVGEGGFDERAKHLCEAHARTFERRPALSTAAWKGPQTGG